jgi:hypothetical protein
MIMVAFVNWSYCEVIEPIMFALFSKLQAEEIVEELGNGLVKTLNSLHLIQSAVHKEECDGYRGSVPVLAC